MENIEQIEREERELVRASLEVIAKAVAALSPQEQALARVVIDKVAFSEGLY